MNIFKNKRLQSGAIVYPLVSGLIVIGTCTSGGQEAKSVMKLLRTGVSRISSIFSEKSSSSPILTSLRTNNSSFESSSDNSITTLSRSNSGNKIYISASSSTSSNTKKTQKIETKIEVLQSRVNFDDGYKRILEDKLTNMGDKGGALAQLLYIDIQDAGRRKAENHHKILKLQKQLNSMK